MGVHEENTDNLGGGGAAIHRLYDPLCGWLVGDDADDPDNLSRGGAEVQRLEVPLRGWVVGDDVDDPDNNCGRVADKDWLEELLCDWAVYEDVDGPDKNCRIGEKTNPQAGAQGGSLSSSLSAPPLWNQRQNKWIKI